MAVIRCMTAIPAWPAGHAVKVSYNRPFFPYNSLFNTDGREADWYMNAAYPMIRWLGRNGYDVTYTSCNDVSNNGSRLLNHKVFITLGMMSTGQKSIGKMLKLPGMPVFILPFSPVMKSIGKQDGNLTMVPRIEPLFAIKRDYGRWYTVLNEPAALNAIILLRNGQGCGEQEPNYDAGKAENALTGQISWVEFPSEIGVPVRIQKIAFLAQYINS